MFDEKALIEQAGRALNHFLKCVDDQTQDDQPKDGDKAGLACGADGDCGLPIAQWTTLWSSQERQVRPSKSSTPSPRNSPTQPLPPSIVVRKHPTESSQLYSVQSVIHGVSALQFWALMASSENRSLWDSTVEDANILCWLGKRRKEAQNVRLEDKGSDSSVASTPWQSEKQRSTYASLAAHTAMRVESLSFGSIMFVVGKRDMVLVSADAQLPSPDGRLRLASTSTSAVSAADSDDCSGAGIVPPRKGYTRFQLNTGGFLVEELPPSGSASAIRVTQLSDLGPMAAWVPSSVVRMVASSLVPRSINIIARVAAELSVPQALSKEVRQVGEEVNSIAVSSSNDGNEDEMVSEEGGRWQRSRHLPPALSATDRSLLQRIHTGGDEQESQKTRRCEGEDASESADRLSQSFTEATKPDCSVDSVGSQLEIANAAEESRRHPDQERKHAAQTTSFTLQNLSVSFKAPRVAMSRRSSLLSVDGDIRSKHQSGTSSTLHSPEPSSSVTESTPRRTPMLSVLDSGSETIPGSLQQSDSSRSSAVVSSDSRGAEEDETLVVREPLSAPTQSDVEVMHGGSTSSPVPQAPEDELKALLCEAQKEDDSISTGGEHSRRRTQTWVDRMSKQHRSRSRDHSKSLDRAFSRDDDAVRRLSMVLLHGSEAIAMAIAPGARDSMASVAAYMSEAIPATDQDLNGKHDRQGNVSKGSSQFEDTSAALEGASQSFSQKARVHVFPLPSSQSQASLLSSCIGHHSGAGSPQSSDILLLRPVSPAISSFQAEGHLTAPVLETHLPEVHQGSNTVRLPSDTDSQACESDANQESLAWDLLSFADWFIRRKWNSAEQILAPDSPSIPTHESEPSAALTAIRQVYARENGLRSAASCIPKQGAEKGNRQEDASSQLSAKRASQYSLDDVKLHLFPDIVMRHRERNARTAKAMTAVENDENGAAPMDNETKSSTSSALPLSTPLPPLGQIDNVMECSKPSALFHEGSQKQRTLVLGTRRRAVQPDADATDGAPAQSSTDRSTWWAWS